MDSLNKPTSKQRLERRSDGWFFPTRNGLQGPFASDEEAAMALDQYILAAQSKASAVGGGSPSLSPVPQAVSSRLRPWTSYVLLTFDT